MKIERMNIHRERFERFQRLVNIQGPADESECAICGSPHTTSDTYGVGGEDVMGVKFKNEFHLCEACVPILYEDSRRLALMGKH